MRARLAILLVGVLWAPAVGRGDEAGGLSGILGGIGDDPKPDPNARPEGDGRGRPEGHKPPPPRAGREPADVPRRIEELRRRIAEMKKVTPADVTPMDGLADAQAEVRRLREALAKAREHLSAEDRAEAARLAKARGDFEARWDKHAKAIEAGQKPDDVAPLEWARMCDDYFWQKADLAADLAAARRRLEHRADRRVAALERAVRDAEEHLEKVRKHRGKMSPGQRKFMARMMAWKAHKARLRAAEHLLAELQKLQADLKGSDKSRRDPMEAETIEQSGFMLSDALRRLVLREFALSDATGFPAPAELDKGLPLPEWMKILDPLRRQQAKCLYAREQLRLANRALANLDDELKADDAAKLTFLRQLGLSEEELKAEAAKLAASRVQRRLQRRDEARRQVEYWKKQVQAESARLEKMTRPPATQPSPPGG